MSEFKASDAVQVITGGPRMTITQVAEDQLGIMTAWCIWFDGTKRMEGTFPVMALRHSPDPSPTSYTGRVARS
jgi:uncharacterized protein YodC (DUF2158 family)